MGCGSSAQKADAGTASGDALTKACDVGKRFASVDPDVLGPHADVATAKLVFTYGKTANIFLIVTPPFQQHQQQQQAYPTDGGDDAAAAGAATTTEEQKAAPAVPEIRWTMFNDSKSDATVEATFFRAEAVRVARAPDAADDAASPVKIERFEGGRVKAELAIPAGATVAFVEGPIKGYMWKCAVYNVKTKSFEPAFSVD
ncbi:hypothetical protein NESM_000847900 [Novymonas esmeraldas]|uniref:DUF1935 domain-containing protein n=1 Tax=Novymonas esmeraldas TaxID=1808958 RepID=A0AAW0F0T4_9TRYP